MSDGLNDNLAALVLNRLQAIDKTLAEDRRESSASRKKSYERIEEMGEGVTLLRLDMSEINHRLNKVETAVETLGPQVAEFVTYKSMAEGAGMFGRALWVIGGLVIAAAFAIVTAWQNFASTISAFFTSR